MRWIMITKTTMVVIFNLQNSHLLTLSLPTEEVFQVNGQNRPVANLPVVDFHSQPREMLTPKPLNTQLPVFLLVYWFSCPSRKVWTSLSVSDTDFLSVLATIKELFKPEMQNFGVLSQCTIAHPGRFRWTCGNLGKSPLLLL